eukprot:TRINITY_DN33803_c0_g1_i1.p1 TRINITY_DN33803_c0_g1~~TRINITY_DN33803_c0_g1_i1.p1  ORF type:complete len:413 (-),score=57.45 TRINITY_DN33803_c0_g1_i1:174-1412(-)
MSKSDSEENCSSFCSINELVHSESDTQSESDSDSEKGARFSLLEDCTKKHLHRPIHITVQQLSGQTLQLELDAEDTIAVLKAKIAAQWNVKASFQKLVLDDKVLECGDTVGAHSSCTSASLSVVMVKTEEPVIARYLAQLQSFSDEDAYDSDGVSVHEDCRARRAARKLRRLAMKGSRAAVLALISALDNRDVMYRIIVALCQVNFHSTAMRCCLGDQDIIRALSPLATVEDSYVQMTVVELLGQVANQRDALAMDTVKSCLNDVSVQVRRSAIGALSQMAQKGDRGTILAICKCLRSGPWLVCQAAAQALIILADQQDSDVLAELENCTAEVSRGTMIEVSDDRTGLWRHHPVTRIQPLEVNGDDWKFIRIGTTTLDWQKGRAYISRGGAVAEARDIFSSSENVQEPIRKT